MSEQYIDYHIARMGEAWAIFRDGMHMGTRKRAVDAIAFANFFADRETAIAPVPVRVTADACLYRKLEYLRLAA